MRHESIGFAFVLVEKSLGKDLSNTNDNSPVSKLKTYALLVSDMVVVGENGAEVLT